MTMSDAQKALLTHAAEVLRASANVIADSYDAATTPDLVTTIVDARDTADKLDAMINPPKSTGHVHEVGSCSCDLDDTKPQGLTKQTTSLVGDDETEMA